MSDLKQLAAEIARTVFKEMWSELLAGKSPILPAYLSPAQAAIYTGFTAKGLEEMRHAGSGPRCSKPNGHSVRYAIKDLDAWMVAGAVDTMGGAK